MGKFKETFNKVKEKASDKYDDFVTLEEGAVDDEDFREVGDYDSADPYEPNIQVAQKPEGFHYFLLEGQWRDLELAVRGYKMVFNKETNKWEVKRKKEHCFIDEEAEEILRTAQTHLSPDIKLQYISKSRYPMKMMALYNQLKDLFYNIAEYKYGRYGDSKSQFFMKQQNHNIFVMLMSRIEANYSRAIQGAENKHTHNAVKAQESLNNSDRDFSSDKGYY